MHIQGFLPNVLQHRYPKMTALQMYQRGLHLIDSKTECALSPTDYRSTIERNACSNMATVNLEVFSPEFFKDTNDCDTHISPFITPFAATSIITADSVGLAH